MPSGRHALAAVAALAAALTAAAPAAADPPDWLHVENGVTQPQFALAKAIEEPLPTTTTRSARPRARA